MNTTDMVDAKMYIIQRQLETIESGYVRVVCSPHLCPKNDMANYPRQEVM